MEKILQKVVIFNEPEIAIVSSRKEIKSEFSYPLEYYGKDGYIYPYEIKKINGYLINTFVNDGIIIRYETKYIDENDLVDINIDKVIKYLPKKITFDELYNLLYEELDIFESFLTDYYQLKNESAGLIKIAKELKKDFGIDIELPEELYNKDVVIECEPGFYNYSSRIAKEDVKNIITTELLGEWSKYFMYTHFVTMPDINIDLKSFPELKEMLTKSVLDLIKEIYELDDKIKAKFIMTPINKDVLSDLGFENSKTLKDISNIVNKELKEYYESWENRED